MKDQDIQKTKQLNVNQSKRRLLLGGLIGGTASLMHASLLGSVINLFTPSSSMAAVPANAFNLSDFGGTPGASPSALRNAFAQAFTNLKNAGGGTLTVAPGVYNLGSYSSEVTLINVADLQNVVISGYGAQLTMTTTAVTMPVFMNFDNPQNITIAGLSFYDNGTDLSVNWQGAVCISVQTSTARSGFKVVDCLAENVVTFFRTYGDYTMEGFDISAIIRNSYYGVNPNYNGRYSKCNIVCENVRRGFMSYGTRNWDITISCVNSGGYGSNGFMDLCPDDTHPVEDCTVNLTASGDLSMYGGLIHFYQQGTVNVSQYTRNVKANAILNNVSGVPVFRFTYEPPDAGMIVSSTINSWEQIQLTGTVNGTFVGTMVANPSVSSATTNSIWVASNIAAYQNMAALPKYFSVFTPVISPSPAPQPAPSPAPTPAPTPVPAQTPPPPTVYPGTVINLSKVTRETGFCYIIKQNFGTPPDTNSYPYRSKLQVYENGKALGPAHTVHVDIASSGRGRFSHYNGGSGQTLRFSASDNSNPRTNGRVYTYKIV